MLHREIHFHTLDYAINITLKDVYLGFIITFLTNVTLALGTILIIIIKDTTIDAIDETLCDTRNIPKMFLLIALDTKHISVIIDKQLLPNFNFAQSDNNQI